MTYSESMSAYRKCREFGDWEGALSNLNHAVAQCDCPEAWTTLAAMVKECQERCKPVPVWRKWLGVN